MNLDLHDYRNTHQWRVEETAESLFFIDVELPNPNTKDSKAYLNRLTNSTNGFVLH